MPEIEKYAPEVYAEKRVQELAFKADVDLTTNFATEGRAATFVYDTMISKEAREQLEKEGIILGLTHPGEAMLKKAEDEFAMIRDDAGRSSDERAAADILHRKSKEDKEKMIRERLKKPFRFAKSFDMFRSMSLSVKPAPGTPEGLKIERYSKHYETFTTYLSNRFSSSLQFSERLLKKDFSADKELAGVVQKKVKYSDLEAA